MKNFKTGLLSLFIIAFTFNFANSQDKEKKEDTQPTMFVVHTDNVKFEMMPKYEELALKLKKSCEENDIENMSWTAISIEDGRYVYVSPIKNMAELDTNPMADLAEKMGKEEMGEMFEEMDSCYDSHGDEIVHYIPKLSYMPEGYSTKDKNEREYHFLYYSPKDAKEMKKAMTDVKNLFETKGVKNGYSVYHSGFGSEESYYMVSIAGESELEIVKGGEENDEILGDDKKAVFWNVIKLTTKYDQLEANIRPDLSYYPNKE
jgi:hypothetical protein